MPNFKRRGFGPSMEPIDRFYWFDSFHRSASMFARDHVTVVSCVCDHSHRFAVIPYSQQWCTKILSKVNGLRHGETVSDRKFDGAFIGLNKTGHSANYNRITAKRNATAAWWIAPILLSVSEKAKKENNEEIDDGAIRCYQIDLLYRVSTTLCHRTTRNCKKL